MASKAAKTTDKLLRLVVDESVHGARWDRFTRYARERRLPRLETIFVAERHPGMPDGEILHHLLDPSTALVTADRPFHNEVLSRGRQSYYVGEETIVRSRLKGVRPRSEAYTVRVDALRESYQPPQSELRSELMPESAKKLKKLRTKRRRIRNHFGGLDNLSEVSVTVSWQALGEQILVGVKIRVSAHVAIKALDASESYVVETVEPESHGAAALAHALVLVVQLLLHRVPTRVYYDAARIPDAVLPPRACEGQGSTVEGLLALVADDFERLEFVPTTKGPLLERLRRKLRDLAAGRSNEIVAGELDTLVRRLRERDPTLRRAPSASRPADRRRHSSSP